MPDGVISNEATSAVAVMIGAPAGPNARTRSVTTIASDAESSKESWPMLTLEALIV